MCLKQVARQGGGRGVPREVGLGAGAGPPKAGETGRCPQPPLRAAAPQAGLPPSPAAGRRVDTSRHSYHLSSPGLSGE